MIDAGAALDGDLEADVDHQGVVVVEQAGGRVGVRSGGADSGGIQGGISNGEAIRLAVAFKPVATIFKPQKTVTRTGEEIEFSLGKGRHDPCVVPRAVPMVEAMAALVLADHMLRRAGARIEDLSR
jgi:chorismate synthase